MFVWKKKKFVIPIAQIGPVYLQLKKICFILDLFDSYDDRDDEGEAGSVEEHKSVIMHLLSQVRLGMDLTKVRMKFGICSKS